MKKIFITAVILSGLLLSARNLLFDPGFESYHANGTPRAWTPRANRGGAFSAQKDSNVKFSGKSSLKLTVGKDLAKGTHMLVQRLKLKPVKFDQEASFSFKIKGEKLSRAIVVITAMDAKKKTLVWRSYPLPKGTFDWETFSGKCEIPAGSVQLYVYIRLRSAGTLWVDNASLTLAKAKVFDSGFIKNPGFEYVSRKGEALNWRPRRPPQGKAVFTTDTKIKYSGNRSAKIIGLRPLHERAHSYGFQQGTKFAKPVTKPGYCIFSFMVRGKEINRPQLIITAARGKNPNYLWKSFALPHGTFDWQEYSGVVAVPLNAERLNFDLRLRSTGTIWFDDVSVAYKEYEPGTISYDGKVNTISGLPGKWTQKKIYGNENQSKAVVVREEGKLIALQQYIAGAPLAGFQHPLPLQWNCSKAFEVTVPFKGNVKLGVEFFDASGKTLGSALTDEFKSSKWSTASIKVAPPLRAKIASGVVMLYNTAKSEARFGEVKIDLCDAEKATKVELPPFLVEVQPADFAHLQQRAKTPVFNTFTDSPVRLHFDFRGNPAVLKKPALVIDLPADVKILDAVCCVHSKKYWGKETFTVSDVKRKEGAYKRFRFENARAFQCFNHQHANIVMLLSPVKAGTVFSDKKVFYHLENNNQLLPERFFVLNMLPAMKKTPNPRRFQFIRWNDEELYFENDEAFLASIRHMEEAGFTWSTRAAKDDILTRSRQSKMLAERGWKFFLRRIALNIHMRNSARAATRLPVPAPILANGKTMPGTEMCPTYQTCHPLFVKRYKESLRKKIRNYDFSVNDWVIIDSEQFRPFNWCFCELCRKEFSKREKSEKILTTEEILKSHRAAWRDFRTWHDTQFLRMASSTAAEFGLKVYDYNYIIDYSRPDYKTVFSNVSKNSLENDKYQGGHLVSYYYTHEARAFDAMRKGVTQLKKPYYPMCGVDAAPQWQAPLDVLTPARFRMMMHSAAAAGCPGLAVYKGMYMDGLFFLAADQVMAVIAAVETPLFDGKIVDAFNIKADIANANEYFRHITRSYKGKHLVYLLNYHGKNSVKVSIAPKNGKKVTFIDQVSGRRITSGTIEIPALNAAVLVEE